MYASHRDGIAAVITDIMMPEMDGVAMLQALRQFDEEVKVIAASGLGTENVVNKLSKLGVEKFLHKPFGAEVLLEALAETLCKRPRA